MRRMLLCCTWWAGTCIHTCAYLLASSYSQVLKTGGKEATYDEFLKELPEADCRYGVFDIEYEDPKTKSSRNKIAFFAWSLYPMRCTKQICSSSSNKMRHAVAAKR